MWRSDAITFLTSACDDALLATVSIMGRSKDDTSDTKKPRNRASGNLREHTADQDEGPKQ